jgi:plastocyanin
MGVAAISLSAPAAVAGDDSDITSFGFTASPASVAPGDTVTLTVTGCEAPTVTVTSGIFDTVTLKKGKPATAVVDPTAKPDADYDVTFDCAGETGTTSLTVSTTDDTGGKPDAGKADTGGKADADKTDAGGRTDTRGRAERAHKGVKAGLGGSVTSTNLSELVAGGVLIAAALGGVLHLRRRAVRDRG